MERTAVMARRERAGVERTAVFMVMPRFGCEQMCVLTVDVNAVQMGKTL
jgi:hypothetical protein